ncbi:hypothetical protein [Candidatus Doolittlea endobia]|uniref:hypothetical protein n=1 Tax=Candidatus Doolittlea endobia TaxID=1778262 RepID=UPI0008331BE7
MRSATENYKDVVVVVDSADYSSIVSEMDRDNGSISPWRSVLPRSIQAFEYIAVYDGTIKNYFGNQVPAYHNDTKQPASRL